MESEGKELIPAMFPNSDSKLHLNPFKIKASIKKVTQKLHAKGSFKAQEKAEPQEGAKSSDRERQASLMGGLTILGDFLGDNFGFLSLRIQPSTSWWSRFSNKLINVFII
ncbi:unnamed protein product [Moneuplotes crassus]|uniref:Uncharacterized protein n=1 Tax=Euplotes crassus TaxID=5936 RepID=A0AAD2D121_EUPCR|nr:unnamed protein product [Moneuplotes crassus]